MGFDYHPILETLKGELMSAEHSTQSSETVERAAEQTVVDPTSEGRDRSAGNWQRGADDAINLSVHLGGAFACRSFALTGDSLIADWIALGCCLFAVVFASFFSNVSRSGPQWLAFVVHAGCILLSLFLFAPQAMLDGLGAYAGIVPTWMAALFGSAMGSLAATGIGDATGD